MGASPVAIEVCRLQNKALDLTLLLQELREFRGGLADTSTLIYLERLGLLLQSARSFSLLLIPQVIDEYGAQPEGTFVVAAPWAGTTDEILCRVARTLSQPVLSEDKHIFRRARALNLSFYNTLMIVLALCTQGHLPLIAFPKMRDTLCGFARYSSGVIAVGDAVYQAASAGTDEQTVN